MCLQFGRQLQQPPLASLAIFASAKPTEQTRQTIPAAAGRSREIWITISEQLPHLYADSRAVARRPSQLSSNNGLLSSNYRRARTRQTMDPNNQADMISIITRANSRRRNARK